MPIFLDSHVPAELPLETIREFIQEAKRGRQDTHGVRPLDLYCGQTAQVYCVTEAASEEAVWLRHAARHLPCGTIQRIDVPGATYPLTAEARLVVRQAIDGAPGVVAALQALLTTEQPAAMEQHAAPASDADGFRAPASA